MISANLRILFPKSPPRGDLKSTSGEKQLKKVGGLSKNFRVQPATMGPVAGTRDQQGMLL